ncbi:MAG: sugar ABC transporter permease [Eubacteriales bacterium]|nr:sugar ABC transporter permease [Eubacteriales bacterium]
MKKKKVYPLYFLILPVAVYGLLFFLPSMFSFYYAMTDWNSYNSEIHFVGFENYKTILKDSKNYLHALGNTLFFTVGTTVLKNGLGLLLALVLNGKVKGKNMLRLIFYLPVTMAPLIVGLIFTSILNPSYGLLNTCLRAIGLGGLTKAWLVNKNTAMVSVVMVEVWKSVGFNMIIYLAGLQTIPKDYAEAASIDGAGKWHVFRYITLPMLMPSIQVNLLLNLINGFKVFELVFILTRGGPGNLTEVLNTLVFGEFSAGRYGLSTAFGVLLLLITAVIAFSSLKILSRWAGGEED